jgi:hypothetical protein
MTAKYGSVEPGRFFGFAYQSYFRLRLQLTPGVFRKGRTGKAVSGWPNTFFSLTALPTFCSHFSLLPHIHIYFVYPSHTLLPFQKHVICTENIFIGFLYSEVVHFLICFFQCEEGWISLLLLRKT